MRRVRASRGRAIAIGAAVGTALGVATDNLALGVGVGVALGACWAMWAKTAA